jgi:hypothetical protein
MQHEASSWYLAYHMPHTMSSPSSTESLRGPVLHGLVCFLDPH